MAPSTGTNGNGVTIPRWIFSLLPILAALGVFFGAYYKINANEGTCARNADHIDTLRTKEIPELKNTLVEIKMNQRYQREKLEVIAKAVGANK